MDVASLQSRSQSRRCRRPGDDGEAQPHKDEVFLTAEYGISPENDDKLDERW